MLAVAFDTLKLARKLESAGMQSKQAQDTSAALSESFTEWLALGNVATREDLQGVESRLEAKISRLETKIEATKAEIMRWMFAQTVVLLGSLFALIHYH